MSRLRFHPISVEIGSEFGRTPCLIRSRPIFGRIAAGIWPNHSRDAGMHHGGDARMRHSCDFAQFQLRSDRVDAFWIQGLNYSVNLDQGISDGKNFDGKDDEQCLTRTVTHRNVAKNIKTPKVTFYEKINLSIL